MNKTIWRCAILSILVLSLTPVEWGQDSHSHASVSIRESKWSELAGSMHVMHAAMTSVQPTGDKFHIEDYQIVNGCQTSNVLYEERAVLDEG